MSSVAMSLDNQVAALQARLVELQKARRSEQIESDKKIAEAQSRNTLSAQVQSRLERCEASLLSLLMEVKSWVRLRYSPCWHEVTHFDTRFRSPMPLAKLSSATLCAERMLQL
jgi:hypothetical protein